MVALSVSERAFDYDVFVDGKQRWAWVEVNEKEGWVDVPFAPVKDRLLGTRRMIKVEGEWLTYRLHGTVEVRWNQERASLRLSWSKTSVS